MANLSKIKRDKMIAFLEQLKEQHSDDESIRAFNEIENQLRDKKYGLVWEEHSEEVDEMLEENIPVLCADPERRLCKDPSLPWNFIIEGDNLQALYLLEKTHRGKVDCIYIDPPYNTGAHDWKYSNDYVGKEDAYRHSKWLSMMKNRLVLAKHLLNPADSILICTIDEKEFLHLGCLLEELFPNCLIQMVSTVIAQNASARKGQFSRSNEYIFFVSQGEAGVQELPLSDEWRPNADDKRALGLRWADLMRCGDNGTRRRSPNCFYPILVSKDGKHFIGTDKPLLPDEDRHTYIPPENTIAIWPIHKDGIEGAWGYSYENLAMIQSKGYVKLGKLNGEKMRIMYLTSGVQKRVEEGKYEIMGYDEDGSIISDTEYRSITAGTLWNIPSHNASRNGTELLKKIIGKRFDYPKSLYAVRDTLRFYLVNKPNAVVLDFFAGSGTTQHAVNLLNSEDGGNRRCIMVTNNEISEAEEIEFTKRGIKKGDTEWEAKGIAKYVTWPRTVCSCNGCDINGDALKGDYLTTDGSVIAMADGFQANVKYFKCEWTPRKPEDYLLSNALCLHIREMIELQNAIEIDNVRNVLLLNKEDFQNIIMNPEIYKQIENVWVNQNMILNSDELAMLRAKGFKYIPREFFGQELREAAE